ncbi:Tyrosinase-like protein 7 [Elsinoe fawcettii]|nr:Tyrosinase-like protein 7 [Elsinoe fawcettii]
MVAIPSPTPVTGLLPIAGSTATRLPIQTLQADFPDVFNLYVLALSAFQSNGNEDLDSNNDLGTSYLQVTGVHGVPFVNWQQDPTKPQYPGIAAGYCTHASTLFLPWHRPYMALYEQLLWLYAQDIVQNQFSGAAQVKYATALKELRLPYWDWASRPTSKTAGGAHLPDIAKQEQIQVTVPGEQPGTTQTKTIHNPLFSYKYTSGMAVNMVNTELQTDSFNESKRCPDADGNQHNEISDAQNFALQDQHTQGIFNLLAVEDYGQFSNTAWRPTKTPATNSYDSVEAHHNNIHNVTGTNMTDKTQDQLTGNMTDLWSSSFDPIFWLHHVNIDRIWAIWQAIHPGSTIDPELAGHDRWTKGTYTMQDDDGSANLEPFHKTPAHNMSDYWTANDMKEIGSTYELGYDYPEAPIALAKDPDALRTVALTARSILYGPNVKQPSFKDAPLHDSPPTGIPNEEASHRREWEAFVRVNRFAVAGSYNIHVFLGPVPDHPADWLLSPNLVGTVSILSPRNIASCQNCQRQRDAPGGLQVSGVVYLTDALYEKLDGDVSADAVVPYLKSNLSWRVARAATEIPTGEVTGLKVGILATPVTYPRANDEIDVVGQPSLFPEITAGKTGGFVEGDVY